MKLANFGRIHFFLCYRFEFRLEFYIRVFFFKPSKSFNSEFGKSGIHESDSINDIFILGTRNINYKK
jgi:hypothetical protein